MLVAIMVEIFLSVEIIRRYLMFCVHIGWRFMRNRVTPHMQFQHYLNDYLDQMQATLQHIIST